MSQRYAFLVNSGVLPEEALRQCTTVDCSVEPSRTKQSFAQEADINFLMDRFMSTGYFPSVEELGGPQAMFGDFSEGISYMEALERVRAADEGFRSLDAKVRDRFRNDPALLLEFLSDPANRGEALKLGLVGDKRAQEPRSARSRAEDEEARKIAAAEAKGRAAAEAPKGT